MTRKALLLFCLLFFTACGGLGETRFNLTIRRRRRNCASTVRRTLYQ